MSRTPGGGSETLGLLSVVVSLGVFSVAFGDGFAVPFVDVSAWPAKLDCIL